MEAEFLHRRFVIVAGKGGVGKSTVCAALGLAAARRGLRTIIAELDTREKAPLFFGRPESGSQPQELVENLFSINIQPSSALREYGLRKLRFSRLYDLVFENDAIKRLLNTVPGMNELLMLGKAFDLEREVGRDGRPAWDLVVIDAPATGHGVSLLRLPDVIVEVGRVGPMVEEAREMRRLLLDAQRTMIILVTQPAEMPVRETLELLHQVNHTLAIPKGYLLINAVWPDPMRDRDLSVMRTMRDALGGTDDVLDGAFACLQTMVRRRRLQEGYLRELEVRVDMPTVRIPFLFTTEFGAEAIGVLSDHILKEAERLATQTRHPKG